MEYYVVDSSVVAAKILEDEVLRPEWQIIFTKAVMGEVELLSPGLLVYEVGNILRTAVLRKRYTLEKATVLFERFFDISVTYIEPEFQEVFLWANDNNLSFYDASYGYLAQKTGYKLLTLDKKLQQLG